MRARLMIFFSQRRLWILLGLVVLNGLILLIVFRHETVAYPTGWDAPYYIERIREFVERGIIAQRFGFVFVIGLIHLVTRVPIISLVAWASPVLMILTAAGLASLVYMATGKSLLAFGLTFVVTLWSPLNAILSTGTFDNAFAMVLLFFGLWILRWSGPSWRRGIAMVAVSSVISLTHFETGVFFTLISGLYLILQLYYHQSIRIWWRREYDIFVAIISGGLVVVWHWYRVLHTLVAFYTTTAGSGGNASIPYAKSLTFTSVLTYLQTGIVDTTILCLALLALIVLGYQVWRRHGRATNLFMAYVLAGYGVLIYAVLRGSIPINRAILIVPVNALIGLGIYRIINLSRRHRPTISVLLILWAYLVLASPTSFIATILRLHPSIPPTTLAAYQSLAVYVHDHRITAYVVLADVPSYEPAASAYYSLWRNWLSATRPAGTTTDQFCIYLGSLANYQKNLPAMRDSQPEYNSTSLEGQRCVNALTQAFPVSQTLFVIQGIQASRAPIQELYPNTEIIAPNLGLVHLPPVATTSR